MTPGSGRSPGEGIGYPLQFSWASLVAQTVKNPPTVQETWVLSLGWEDPLEKGMATHSRILGWRIHGPYSPWGHKESDTAKNRSLTVQILTLPQTSYVTSGNSFNTLESKFSPLKIWDNNIHLTKLLKKIKLKVKFYEVTPQSTIKRCFFKIILCDMLYLIHLIKILTGLVLLTYMYVHIPTNTHTHLHAHILLKVKSISLGFVLSEGPIGTVTCR